MFSLTRKNKEEKKGKEEMNQPLSSSVLLIS